MEYEGKKYKLVKFDNIDGSQCTNQCTNECDLYDAPVGFCIRIHKTGYMYKRILELNDNIKTV
jgi:hypothetical protein